MKKLILILFVSILLFACNKESAVGPQDTSQTNYKSAKSNLNLDFTGLIPLGSGYRYEGWIIVDGLPVSTGKFKITPSGNMAPSKFNVNADDLENATAFVLTIEPQPDHDPAPSDVHLMGGDFIDGTASLTISYPGAFGTDFSNATGTFILATPTTSSSFDNVSGIWFLDLSSGTPMAGLNLPDLPNGWLYEGWAVIDGLPVTTGKFSSVSGSDMAAPYSGPGEAPPFPGEDFIFNAPDGAHFPPNLQGQTAVITIEPNPDNSNEPFIMKPLVGSIPNNATDHVNYPMSLNTGSFPTGTASK